MFDTRSGRFPTTDRLSAFYLSTGIKLRIANAIKQNEVERQRKRRDWRACDKCFDGGLIMAAWHYAEGMWTRPALPSEWPTESYGWQKISPNVGCQFALETLTIFLLTGCSVCLTCIAFLYLEASFKDGIEKYKSANEESPIKSFMPER